jgi:hypothetical protein
MWKIDRNIFEIELFFRVVKISAATASLIVIFISNQVGPIASIVLVGGFAAISWFFWDRLGRKGNDLWSDRFVKQFNRSLVPRSHYFEQIGDLVKSIVAMAAAQDRYRGEKR